MKKRNVLKKTLSLLLAFAMVMSFMPMALAEEVLVISTADDLKAFATQVNNGDSFEGKLVQLANDIDLDYTAVVIGTKENSFKGTFDGQEHVVSNLTIYENGSDSDYFADSDDNLGLFGVINTPAVIKNVTVHNPYIVGSAYVGGIVGQAYTGKIDNCHVTGEIDIEGFYMVGGITGHGYAKISNCSVIGAEGWDYNTVCATYKEADLEGDNVGGIVGHNAETNSITNCSVKNLTVSGTRKVGGIVGITAQNGHVVNCSVENVTVGTTATAEYAADNAKTMSIGGIVGQYQAYGNNDGTLTDCSVSGLTFTNENNVTVSAGAISGGLRGSVDATVQPADTITVSGNTVESVTGSTVEYLEPEAGDEDAPAETTVATVDGVGFTDIQEAIKAAAPNGTVEITSDIIVDEWIMFAESLSIGNGNIITKVIDGLTINGNDHSLTINSIESANNGNRMFFDATNLNINDLTIELNNGTSGIGMKSGILNNVTFIGGGYGVLPQNGDVTITGCTFKTDSTSIYFEEARDNLVVTGCTFENAENANVILLRGGVEFTNNTVISGRTVNVVSGSPVVTGNDFGDVRLKVYNEATASIENNTINNLAFNDETPTQSVFGENTLSEAAQSALDAVTGPATLSYAEFNELVRNAEGGVYDGNNITVVLKDSERSYQNNKTAQFFIGGTNVNITDPVEAVKVSNVNFIFEDDDTTNTYTSGELQVFADVIEFTGCTFDGVAVSPWGVSNTENAESATFTGCTWNNLSGRYGIHQNRASSLTVSGCAFNNCERGIHTNSSTVSSITITNNTFTGIGDDYGVLCLAEGNGDLSKAILNISGNTAEGQVMLRQLSASLTYEQVSDILDTSKNTYGTAYVSGSIEPSIPAVAKVGDTYYSTLVEAMGKFNGRTVEVLCDVEENIEGFYGVTLTTNVEGGVSITTTNTGWVDFDDVTVEDGVTVNIPNAYSGDSENVIHGTLNVGETYYHGYDAKTTVENGGNITVGDSTILRYNETADAGLYIYGDGDDSTVEFDCDYYIGAYSGTFYVENANVKAGYFLLKNSYDNSNYADIDMTLDESELIIKGTSDGQDSFIIDDQAALTLKNGSSIEDVRDFNILSGANLTLSVDATSSISATNVSIAEDVPFEKVENEDGSFGIAPSVPSVAKIGDVEYDDLQKAIDAANAGDTIVLLTDMTFESDLNNAAKGCFNIADGKNVIIDLNGKTINVTDNSTGNFIVFYNYGELTIKNGAVNLTSTENRAWNAESAIILNRGGIVNMESGTYTHKGGTDMAFVLDNSGNYYGDATANISGTTALDSTYVAIRNRMEQNSHGLSGTAYLNISGGTISGTSRAVWAQAATSSTTSPATGEINITGGEIGLIDTPRSAGADCMTTISGGTVAAVKSEVGELTVTGGTITGTITILNASGEEVNYTITDSGLYVAAVAKIGETAFATLAEAFAAAADGETITLLADVELTSTLYLSKEGTITIDGNGKAITLSDSFANTDSIAAAIALGATGAGDDQAATHVYNFNNVAFDGITGSSIIRAEGVTLNMDGCTVANCNMTVGNGGLIRLESTEATIKNTVFENNITNNGHGVITHNYNSDASESELVIDNCEFNINSVVAPGVVYYATGGACTVSNSEFVENSVNTNGNAATLYAGFNDMVTVTGNLFKNNAITTSNTTSKRVAGGLFVGAYGAGVTDYTYDVSGNAFIGNTATKGDGTAAPSGVAFSDYEDGIDLSDNYWGTTDAPEVGTNYSIEKANYEVSVDSYYTSYTTDENGNVVLEDIVEIVSAVAQIGENKFATLAEAFAAADGDTIVLLTDIALDETIKSAKTVTLDLAGKTITGTDNATGSFALIEVQPGAELTIDDTSADKTGKITLTATNDRDFNNYSSVISNQRGKLTVNGGTIEHLGGTDMAYGIDTLTNGKGTYAETIINGGTVKSTYRGIRQFLNGVEAQNILTVNGGTVEGANRSIWMQQANANANPGTLTVEAQASLYGDVLLSANAAATEYPVTLSLAAAALKNGATVVTGSTGLPKGFEIKEANGAWGVVEVSAVAKIGDVEYETIEAAINAADDGDEIIVLSAVTVSEETAISKNITITGADDTATVNANALLIVQDGVTFASTNLTGNYYSAAGATVTVNTPKANLYAKGDITFNGANKVLYFSAGSNHVVTIGADDSLEVTNRIVVSYGNKFNITGNIENAKETNKENLTPTLNLVGGISLNGGGADAELNVENAYVVIGDSTSKNNGATGIFNINFTNSIVDFTKTLKTYEPTASGLAPTFNFNIKDSVVASVSHIELWRSATNLTLDNSDLTVGGSFANAGVLNIVNGSEFVVKAPIMSSHGGNTGTIIIDGAVMTLADSNQDWENAGTIKLTDDALLNIWDFKCVTGGSIIIDAKDMPAGTTSKVIEGGQANKKLEGFVTVENGDDVTVTYGEDGDVTLEKAEAGLSGSGTEEDPYMINNVDDLELFRASVNAGETTYNDAGVWVALGADIDLDGVVWNSSIGDGDENFYGYFDGKGFAIKNLTVEKTVSTYYQCASLFGNIYGDVVIKDLTLENPTIKSSGSGNCIGALVGFAWDCQDAVIENVKVTGDIAIDAPEVSAVGGVVGYAYNPLTIKNCSVIGNDGSYINARSQVGGIIGYVQYGASKVLDCTVENVTITSRGYMGGIAGVVQTGNVIDGCTVEDVSMVVTTEESAACVGSAYGAVSGTVSVVDHTTINTTVTYTDGTVANASTAGGGYSSKEVSKACIGDVYYETFKAAINAAKAGEIVTLLADAEVTEDLTISGIEIAAGDYTITNKANLTVKDGAVITGTPVTAEAYAVITNKGTLTVEGDSTKIATNHTIAPSTAYAVNAITNAGTLIVNGGTIENTSTSTNQIGYAIDNNSGTADAIVTINGGEVKASGSYYYDGIRQFANSIANENSVFVTGGSVGSIWMQNPSDGTTDKNTKDVKGSIAVTGGNVGSIYLEPSSSFAAAVTGGTIGSLSYFETDSANADRNLAGFVSGGTFTSNPGNVFAVEGFEFVANEDGTFGIAEKAAAVATVTSADGTVTNYPTLADAVAAAEDGDLVAVIANIADEAVKVDKSITITADAENKPVLNNVSITGSGAEVELTVNNLKFTGSSYINSGNIAALTVTGVDADVEPTKLSGRSAFIVLNTGESTTGLKLTVTYNTIKSAQSGTDFYGAAIFGWGYLGDTVISNNVFGSDVAPYNFIAVKTMNVLDGAKFTIEDNTIYGTNEYFEFCAFDLYQNNSRANAYTVVSKDNTFNIAIDEESNYAAYAFCIEGNTAFADTTNVVILDSGSSISGEKLTLADFETSSKGDYDKYYGVDVALDADGKITAGTFAIGTSADALNAVLADGYVALKNLDGNYIVGAKPTATVNDLGALTVPAGDYMSLDSNSSEDMPLSFVMQFLADQDEEDMATSPYAQWYGDFVITFTGLENGSFSTEGCYLAGYYGDFGWVKVPITGILSTVEEGVRYPVMLGVGMGQKYDDICTDVKDFRCAMFLTEDVLEANPNLKVNLELSVVDNSKGEEAAANALAGNDATLYNKINSIEYDAEDFEIKKPSGEVAYRAYVNDSEDREGVQVDLANVYAKESFVVKLLDSEGNVLTTTTLKNGGVEAESYTANIVLWGRASSSWDTEIHTTLTADNVPETIEVWADGVLVDTYENALGAGTNVDETADYLALDCVEKELIKFTSINSKLGNYLSLFFFVLEEDITDTGSYAVVTHTYADGREPSTEVVPFSAWEKVFYNNKQQVRFEFSGIAAKEMSDNINVVIYDSNDKVISESLDTSLKAYIDKAVVAYKDFPEIRTAIVDMANYGATAQKQWSYNLSNLANANITAEQQSWATSTVEYDGSFTKGEHLRTITLSLENNIVLNFYFLGLSEGSYAQISYTDHDNNAVSYRINSEDIVKHSDAWGWIIAVDKLVIADYKTPVTCTVYNADGTVYDTAICSMDTYCSLAKNDMTVSLMKFASSAYAYLH